MVNFIAVLLLVKFDAGWGWWLAFLIILICRWLNSLH